MKSKEKLAVRRKNPRKEFQALVQRLHMEKAPSEDDVARFREIASDEPELWSCLSKATDLMRETLIKKFTNGLSRAQLLAEADVLAQDLGHDKAPPLERLLIDQILTAKAYLHHAEYSYNAKISEPMSLNMGAYWQHFYSSAQRRYLRAIETLARVRRLSRNTPLFQFNIAGAGGRQMNFQGELFGEKPSLESGSTAVDTVE